MNVFAATSEVLPSGHTGLPRAYVDASQRQRLLNGVAFAVAEKSFGATTVADITARAGVSKKTFYEHFTDKLACFLAAYDHGRDALMEAVNTASRAAVDAGVDPIMQLRHATRAYLAFLSTEDVYARTFCIEVIAAGPEAIARHRACRADFAASLRLWHELARERNPAWPAATGLAYEAATGAAFELAVGRIATGRTAELPDLEDIVVDAQLAMLRVPVASV